jgi:DNA-binding transcriptional ArsR family regulator
MMSVMRSGPVAEEAALSSEELVAGLKALGEPTRLRIAALVSEGELTVSELCRILGQSQPRVSRHLRLLCDAGLLDRHSEGTSAFFSLSSRASGGRLLGQVVSLVDADDAQLVADRHRLSIIRSERAAQAVDYFDRIAGQWESMRTRHVADAEVEALIVDLVDQHRRRDPASGRPRVLLDIGTGTGRILELLADRFDQGIGIDLSTNMLNVARSRLLERGLANCTVRQANVYSLDLGEQAGVQLADIAVLHHVLHFLDDPAAALEQTALALATGGRAVIVDFGPHSIVELRTEHNHRWMGFSDEQIERWCDQASLDVMETRHLNPNRSTSTGEPLTTTIWLARRRP